MTKDKKVIGVCLTKIHDIRRSDYANRLHHLAQKVGYKLIFFNSFVDFYHNDAFDTGAKSVYDVINYDIVDALIVLYDSFYNRSVADEIIARAKERNVPVVLINGEKEGCLSVAADYNNALKTVIRHIICEHGITDTFFLAGTKGDAESEKRLNCYKAVLSENGLPFEESRVDYGDYWEDPARRVVKRLVKDGKKPPRAIFCANDYMAFAVIYELRKQGYSVPEDVIVTGFDGVPAAEHYSPQLTTCKENIESLAALSLEAAAKALEGADVTDTKIVNEYVPFISESCGCRRLSNEDYHDAAAMLYNTLDAMEMHEDFMHNWIDHVLKGADMNGLYETLAGCVLENSFICMNNDILARIMGTDGENQSRIFTDSLVVISSKYTSDDSNKTESLAFADMVPSIAHWTEDKTSYILSAVYIGEKVCGYYAVCTDNINSCKHKIKRVLKTINITFNIVANHLRQARLRMTVENASLTNSVTGLPNLKGAAKWFNEFAAVPENHERAISVSVYGLPKYTYIYENYGIEAAEEALHFVAESLKIANPTECFLAHISEDEFVVINYFNDPNVTGEIINKATSVFFSLVEGYNTRTDKGYYVEVNCGCTEGRVGWDGSLESFIKLANGEMYMNRLKYGMGSVIKEESAPKEYYKAFNVLIEKNLFHYHFQPIVDARTGDIYAYEALMRTDQSIGMNPLQILDTAKKYNRLYEIERATIFNVIGRVVSEQENFIGTKVFINTIPGHFLNEEDIDIITSQYGDHLDKFVFELTEQDTVSDEELTAIRTLGGLQSENQIAIDDYGTGHSNIVNLMRYAPQIIKIDRFLVTDIHKDENKQMFVRNIIEFARMNDIKVLAEGVETSDEMRMAISLGVDLIQGYYTGRPALQPISAIADDIRTEIININSVLC